MNSTYYIYDSYIRQPSITLSLIRKIWGINLRRVEAKSDQDLYNSLYRNIRTESQVESILDVRSKSRATEILNLIKITPKDNVLDIGSASCIISQTLQKMTGATFSCIDVLPAPSSLIPGVNYSQVSADELKFDTSYFDHAIALMSLHHIENIKDAVQQLARVLKPKATLVVREHELPVNEKEKSDTEALIQLEHILYELKESKGLKEHDYAHYYTKEGLNNLLSQYFDLVVYQAPRTENNPTKYYWSLWHRKENVQVPNEEGENVKSESIIELKQNKEKDTEALKQDMGILNFYGPWLTKRYPSVILSEVPSSVSSLSIDMGGLIHLVAKEVYGAAQESLKRTNIYTNSKTLEENFQSSVCKKIEEVIYDVKPEFYVFLCVDGLAPLAKIQQQRQRRFKSAAFPENPSSYELEHQPNKPGLTVFDKSNITTGTDFMENLNFAITKWLHNKANGDALLPQVVFYSSHQVEGEGEHKIMDYFRSLNSNNDRASQGNHIVYGKDADLIILSLVSPLSKIYIKREDDIYNGKIQVVDIDALKRELLKEGFRNMYEFVALTFLLGNDFLPHNPCFHDVPASMDVLFQVYRSLNLEIANEDGIIWDNYKLIISEIAKEEAKLLLNLYIFNTKVSYVNMLENCIKDNNFYFSAFRYLWYIVNFTAPYDEDNDIIETKYPIIQNSCLSYLDMIRWCFSYYCYGGNFVNWGMFYNGHFAPLMTDLANVANNNYELIDISDPDSDPEVPRYTTLQQLLCVIPTSSYNILPRAVQHLMFAGSEVRDLYPEGFAVEWSGKEISGDKDAYANYGVAYIPLADFNRITQALTNSAKVNVDQTLKQDLMIQIDRSKKSRYTNFINELRSGTRNNSNNIIPRGNNTYRGRESHTRGGNRGNNNYKPSTTEIDPRGRTSGVYKIGPRNNIASSAIGRNK